MTKSPPAIAIAFSTWLKKTRATGNLTQDQIAKRLEVSRNTVTRWETDASSVDLTALARASAEFEDAILDILGVTATQGLEIGGILREEINKIAKSLLDPEVLRELAPTARPTVPVNPLAPEGFYEALALADEDAIEQIQIILEAQAVGNELRAAENSSAKGLPKKKKKS